MFLSSIGTEKAKKRLNLDDKQLNGFFFAFGEIPFGTGSPPASYTHLFTFLNVLVAI